jgi:hypothetical protein
MPIRIRANKTSRRYACDTTPITRRADTPITPLLIPYCYLNQQALYYTALRTNKPYTNTAHDPNKISCCYTLRTLITYYANMPIT